MGNEDRTQYIVLSYDRLSRSSQPGLINMSGKVHRDIVRLLSLEQLPLGISCGQNLGYIVSIEIPQTADCIEVNLGGVVQVTQSVLLLSRL